MFSPLKQEFADNYIAFLQKNDKTVLMFRC